MTYEERIVNIGIIIRRLRECADGKNDPMLINVEWLLSRLKIAEEGLREMAFQSFEDDARSLREFADNTLQSMEEE